MEKQFIKEYWTEAKSIIEFIPSNTAPSIPITAVKLCSFKNNRLLMTKLPKGWDLPGGHIEVGETPDEALAREISEETGGSITSSCLIGYLKIEQEIRNKLNAHYPKLSCILIYKGNIDSLDRKKLIEFEANDCKYIPINLLERHDHNWTELKRQIVEYAVTGILA